MGYILKKVGSSSNAPIVEYYCDTELDLNDLPTNVPMGSLAHIINNGRVFVLNSEGNWVKQTLEAVIQMSSNDYTDEDKEKVDAIPDDPKYTDTNTTYELATEEEDGLMSAADKILVNQIESILARLDALEFEPPGPSPYPEGYVFNFEDWTEHLDEIEVDNESVAIEDFLLESFGIEGSTFYTYEGEDDYIVLPDQVVESETLFALYSLESLLSKLEDNLITAPTGVAGIIHSYSVFTKFSNLDNSELELIHLDVSEMTNMDNMFSGSLNLTTLDLSTWDLSNVVSVNNMFTGCASLESVYVRTEADADVILDESANLAEGVEIYVDDELYATVGEEELDPEP